MGRSRRIGRAGGEPAEAAPWWEDVAGTARSHGAMPYVVEGFTEISDAVRRGHAVLVRREQAEVADGMTIFESGATPVTGAFAPGHAAAAPIVAILRFDVGTARYVLQDAQSPTGAVQLTPRRLARYLESPDRSVGVALGA